MRVPQKVGTKGSLRWIQRLIEYDSERFNRILRNAGVLAPDATVDWVSPRAEDEWSEYRDVTFLQKLWLEKLADILRDYWPTNGPQWDALGIASDGHIILVEAKAHVGELASTCAAESPSSRERIARALGSTRTALGADGRADWMTPYYQYANRLAFLQFLTSHGVNASLVFLYFTDDTDMPEPRDRPGFERAIADVHKALGFPPNGSIPHVVDLFLDVAEIAGSANNPERRPADYNYNVRFADRHAVHEVEGGTIYAAHGPEGFAVITDESTLADIVGEEDVPAIGIRIFSTAAARDSYLDERGWR